MKDHRCIIGLRPWFMPTGLRSELTIRCSYASSQPDYFQAIELIEQGEIPYQTLLEHYPLADGKSAFEDALAQRNIKPVLRPD